MENFHDWFAVAIIRGSDVVWEFINHSLCHWATLLKSNAVYKIRFCLQAEVISGGI